MMSSGINLVMTVIGFAVSILFLVFVCTRLMCARIQLSASRRSFPNGFVGSDFSTLERGFHGLEPVMVANFPTKKFSDDFFSSVENSRCTICLADYHKDDTLRILPSCGHSFHSNCIDVWLLQHSTCPVCRISLRDVIEKNGLMQPLSSAAAQYHCGTLVAAHPYHHIMPGQEYASRTDDNYGNNSSHVDQLPPEIVTTNTRTIGFRIHGCNQITKASENKHAEDQLNS